MPKILRGPFQLRKGPLSILGKKSFNAGYKPKLDTNI
jgi:hypothetical protein